MKVWMCSVSVSANWHLKGRKMLDPSDPRAPKIWTNETSGRLKPAVERYLNHQPLSAYDVVILREYLRQWIDSPVWRGDGLEHLRESVRRIRTQRDLDEWLEFALSEGHDPL